ncbi:MAG: chondroitinase-B domain-containing protein [Acidobacteriota bacterium]
MNLLERFAALSLFSVAAFSLPVLADDTLHTGTATLDPPTLAALGVRLPVTGDDNFNASVTVQYRKNGAGPWNDAQPLFRVHPEVVTGFTAVPEFAGSIFTLRPDTSYEIRLHITDPDGNIDESQTLTARTRPVPQGPKNPRLRRVRNAGELTAALASALPGDVILLAKGVYSGSWSLTASGTADQPIVIRGTSQDDTILDGQNCTSCNVLEVFGSYVQVENLTIRNAIRALRFNNADMANPTTGNVARRLHIIDTAMGIGSRVGQSNFYIADNVLEGRLQWPLVYTDDNGLHSNDDGIRVTGSGHVVAHNRISGYGDAMKTEQAGARSVDFYGNDVLWTYDNGVELDQSAGNVRVFGNRFTNTFATISAQPVFGGPVYIFRNLVYNVANEQLKFHPLSGNQPSGMLVYNNTFVSPVLSLNLQTGATSHYFSLENNLFVGPVPLTQPFGFTVDWGGPMDHAVVDHNGYSPDGLFGYGAPNGGYNVYAGFADMQAQTGREANGVVLAPLCANGSPFASCLAAPAAYTFLAKPPDPKDLVLASSSTGRNSGLPLANVNNRSTDMGAVPSGCPSRLDFGQRPPGVDERNQLFQCEAGE